MTNQQNQVPIDQIVAQFRNAVVAAVRDGKPVPTVPGLTAPPRSKAPRKTPEQRTQELRAHLRRIHDLRAASDAKRIKMLLQESLQHLELREWGDIYALAAEVMHMARIQAMGIEAAHPILVESALPPPPRLPSEVRTLRGDPMRHPEIQDEAPATGTGGG